MTVQGPFAVSATYAQAMITLQSKVNILLQRLFYEFSASYHQPAPAGSPERHLESQLIPLVAVDLAVYLHSTKLNEFRSTQLYGVVSGGELDAMACGTEGRIIVAILLTYVFTVYIHQFLSKESPNTAISTALTFYSLYFLSRLHLVEIQEEHIFYIRDTTVPFANRSLRSIPTRQFQPALDHEQGYDCSIYQLECIGEGEWVYGLVCGHQFHRYCLGEWLYAEDALGNRGCPLCRAEIFGGASRKEVEEGDAEWVDAEVGDEIGEVSDQEGQMRETETETEWEMDDRTVVPWFVRPSRST